MYLFSVLGVNLIHCLCFLVGICCSVFVMRNPKVKMVGQDSSTDLQRWHPEEGRAYARVPRGHSSVLRGLRSFLDLVNPGSNSELCKA